MPDENTVLQGAPQYPWYESVGFVLLILLFFGPFGLPLLYKSRRFNRPTKIVVTILIILITVYATILTIHLVQDAIHYYNNIFNQVSR